LLEESEQLPGDDPLKAPFRFARVLPLAEAAGDVGAGLGIGADAGEHDGVQGWVELPVTAAVEAMAVGQARWHGVGDVRRYNARMANDDRHRSGGARHRDNTLCATAEPVPACRWTVAG
jgi:hypothetical protein